MTHPLADLLQDAPEEGPAERLRVALELHESGLEMVAARLRRQHPELTESERQERVRAWLLEAPLPAGGGRQLTWEEWVARR